MLTIKKKQLTINAQIGRPVDVSDIPKRNSVYQRIAPKTPAGIRTVPVSDFVLDEIAVTRERYLKKFGEHYDDYYQGYLCPNQFGEASNRAMYGKYFKALKKQMGMPADFHWHDLRHAFATVMEDNRVNLKELSEVMGHCSSDFTLKVYVEKKQPVFEGMKEYLDILEHAVRESGAARAAPATSRVIEYPGDPFRFTQLIEQARSPDDQGRKDRQSQEAETPRRSKTAKKSLATRKEIPYNYSC